MRSRDRLHDREAEPRPAARAPVVSPGEALERLGFEPGRESAPVVGDLERCEPVVQPSRQPHPACAVSQSVIDQVAECLLDASAVELGDEAAGSVEDDPSVALARSATESIAYAREQRAEVDPFPFDR
jgi:hypothetical protein